MTESPALARYRARLEVLLAAREAAGGELSEEEESRHVEELDALWAKLTDDERDDATSGSGKGLETLRAEA